MIARKKQVLFEEEYRTTELIRKALTSFGFDEVYTGIAGGKTGVIGILLSPEPGPTIALRADIDALPIQEKNRPSFCFCTNIPAKRKSRFCNARLRT